MAQRAGKKRLAKQIHAKIANIRKDWNHKTANAILKDAKAVFVGDVSSVKLAKTSMAKSVLDSGWGQLRSFLIYKSRMLGTTVKEVNESWTSRTCSVCGAIGEHQGLSGLSVREWTCASCGTQHDRDVNAAINILRVGNHTPIKGIPRL
jgi:IS605 OrfB family transposase